MKLGVLLSVPLIALTAFGCTQEEDPVNTAVQGQNGVSGVMPTIGKIYIEDVQKGANDGDLSDMRRAHLIYTLSGDIVVNDYSILDGGAARCVWESNSADTVLSKSETILAKNENTGLYECEPVTVDFNKQDNADYNPDSVITLSFKDNQGRAVTSPATGAAYATTTTLNTTDRHNLINLATSPTSVLFYRRDGLFQSGYTAYRGLLGLEKYIGTAVYEGKVEAPGGAGAVDPKDTVETYAGNVERNIDTINKWLNGESDVDKIKSSNAFVSSYGPPIALPPFREGEIDYTKLRVVLMRHNNSPIIISNDKKLYTMGIVSKFSEKDLKENYIYHIRSNDNWFSYSGVDIHGDYSSNKLHVGEIKPMNGVKAKFVNTLSVTSDLGTIISLNETDREYYIAGNPHYNNSFCEEKAVYDEVTMAFNFNNTCTYNASVRVGAVKIPGLQRLIGDGNNALADDNSIYYTGSDGKMYVVRIDPSSANYNRIKNGEDVMPELLKWKYSEEDIQNGADKLYATEMALANMNHALIPTLLLNDGSVAFPMRQGVTVPSDPNDPNSAGKVEIQTVVKHFYVNADNATNHKAGDTNNIRMVKLLGPTVALGEDGKLYYFTDVPALGISYNPQSATTVTEADAATGSRKVERDNDYLSFIYGDPVQQFSLLETTTDQERLFNFKYGVLDINAALAAMNDKETNIGSDFVLMPYNPYTDSAEDIVTNADNSVTVQSVPYKPYRTNTHLFVNMSRGAVYNYLLVPHYMYAFDRKERNKADQWIYKENGLIAGEVRHNDIAKAYGSFSTPEVPFKYTPYGRNTAFFGNKKGVFSFVSYNVRKTISSKVNMNGQAMTSGGESLRTALPDDTVPDYFYKAAVFGSNNTELDKTTNVREEASSKNNYISNPFVTETRMSNFPNNADYKTKGFEPQLLSSWINTEIVEYPNTENNPQANSSIYPAYIPQFLYQLMTGEVISAESTSSLSRPAYEGINITLQAQPGVTKCTNGACEFVNKLYQYAYGVGMYRIYSVNSYPVWRSRKLNTEILQQQTRFGSLIPMTHGDTATFLFSKYKELFDEGIQFNNTAFPENEDSDGDSYIYPRMYSLTMYTTYDADRLRSLSPISDVILGGINIQTDNLGATIQKSAKSDIDGMQGMAAQGSGVGYVLLDGNFMWRAGSDAASITGTPVSGSDPLNKAKYFSKFVAYHNK